MWGTLQLHLNSRSTRKRDCSELLTFIEEPQSGNNPLCALPAELLCIIVDYLPSESEACLTLTCKSLALRIGFKSWTVLADKERMFSRAAFLEMLSLDYPELIPCHACGSLHSWRHPPVCEMWKRPASSIILIPGSLIIWFTDVQLIMRAHRLKAEYGLSLNTILQNLSEKPYLKEWPRWLQCSQIRVLGPGKWNATYVAGNVHKSNPVKCSAELRIVEDALLLKGEATKELKVRFEDTPAKYKSLFDTKLFNEVADIYVPLGCRHRNILDSIGRSRIIPNENEVHEKINLLCESPNEKVITRRVDFGAANRAALTLSVYLAYPEAVKFRSRCYRGGVLGKECIHRGIHGEKGSRLGY